MQQKTTVVISHFNAWEPDQLIHLLDQVASIPAGCPFDVRVVVNRAVTRDLYLPERHRHIEVAYRENRGYNIGAWDHGWRVGSPAQFYLFLQEECSILRPNWLGAFVRRLRNPRIGVLGETIAYHNTSWNDMLELGDELGSFQIYKNRLTEWGVPTGPTVSHLRSLVIGTRRDVLERINGFRSMESKEEAITAEIAITKEVEAQGLRAEQVALRPFSYVAHPQWEEDRQVTLSWKWAARRLIGQHLGLASWHLKHREQYRKRGLRYYSPSPYYDSRATRPDEHS